MQELLHHAPGVLLALPTWFGPLLFLPVARAQLERSGSRGLWRAWLGAVLMLAVLSIVGWYASPETSGSPFAALASELILAGPPLAVTAVVLQETRDSALPGQRRMAIAGLLGMGALMLCFMPAVMISSALGGVEIGSPC